MTDDAINKLRDEMEQIIREYPHANAKVEPRKVLDLIEMYETARDQLIDKHEYTLGDLA